MTRLIPALFSVALAALPAAAEDRAIMTSAPAAGPVTVTISYAITAPLASVAPEAIELAASGYRQSLYRRAVKECSDLLATIASECQITGINISTQVNSYPGQPTTLYVNGNVTTQITLTDAR